MKKVARVGHLHFFCRTASYMLVIVLIACSLTASAAVKTWVGGSTGSWSVGSNWSPTGVPATATNPALGDDIIFTGVSTTVTITDFPALANTLQYGQLTLSGSITVNISGTSTTYMYFGSGFTINSGCRLNIGGTTSAIFEFGNKGTTANTGLIYGTLDMQGTGTNATTNRKIFSAAGIGGSTRVYGTLLISGPSANISSSWVTLYIESGGQLEWARDGMGVGTPLSGLYCQDGGIINLTGIVSTELVFNNIGNYYGLIIWDNPGQTGQAIPVVPSVGLLFHVDSVRIVNTGSGSASLGRTPCYSVGHLEVQGGIMYLGTPAAATCGTQVITSDLKLTGGTLIGNATFPGDGTAAYPIGLPVNRDFIMTGGTFDFSNRPTGLAPSGALQLSVGRHVLKTGGTIQATSGWGSQNLISLNSSSQSQNLQINSFGSGTYVLVPNNTSATQGVNLVDNVTIPSNVTFYLLAGRVSLGAYNLTLPYDRLLYTAGPPQGRIHTGGSGKLVVTGMPASQSVTLPVAALPVNSYEPVTISSTASAITNSYAVRTFYGNSPGGIYSPTKTIRRTWIITPGSGIVANSVGLTFRYHDTTKGSACNATGLMELGHFVGSAWNVDPAGTTVTPAGANPYTAGPFYPNALDSAFVVGNRSSILAAERRIQLTAQRQPGGRALLSWNISNNTGIIEQSLEYAADGRNFSDLVRVPSGLLNYTDAGIPAGIRYYRLRITDADGQINYSNVVALWNGTTWAVTIAGSNLVGDQLPLTVMAPRGGMVQISVTDVQGRSLIKEQLMLNSGENRVVLDTRKLGAGMYNLMAFPVEGSPVLLRFIKK